MIRILRVDPNPPLESSPFTIDLEAYHPQGKPVRIEYQWNHQDWRILEGSKVTLSNVPPGNLEFQARARDEEDQVSQPVRKSWRCFVKAQWAVISGNGKRILTLDDHVRAWDADKAKEIARIRGLDPKKVHRVAISPDGAKGLAIGQEPFVFVLDLESGQLLGKKPLLDQITGGGGVTFSHDGRSAAAFRYGEILAWDLASGKEWFHFRNKKSPCNTLAFSSDDKLIALVDGQNKAAINIYEVKTGKRLYSLRREVTKGTTPPLGMDKEAYASHRPRTLIFFAQDKKICASDGGIFEVWELPSGKWKRISNQDIFNYKGAHYLTKSRDEKRILWSLSEVHGQGSALCLFDPTRWAVVKTYPEAIGSFSGGIRCGFLSADGTRIVNLTGRGLSVFNAETGVRVGDYGAKSLENP